MNLPSALLRPIPILLGIAVLTALTGCVGYVDGGYNDGGGVYVAGPDFFGYGGGGYDHGRDVHGYSQRGAVSRGGGGGGHGGGGGGHGGGGGRH